jgi:hypothetical protein
MAFRGAINLVRQFTHHWPRAHQMLTFLVGINWADIQIWVNTSIFHREWIGWTCSFSEQILEHGALLCCTGCSCPKLSGQILFSYAVYLEWAEMNIPLYYWSRAVKFASLDLYTVHFPSRILILQIVHDNWYIIVLRKSGPSVAFCNMWVGLISAFSAAMYSQLEVQVHALVCVLSASSCGSTTLYHALILQLPLPSEEGQHWIVFSINSYLITFILLHDVV